MGKIKIQKNEYEKIVDLYKSGVSRKDIADKYGVSLETIVAIIKKCNVDGKSVKGMTIPKSEYDRIAKMYIDGMTQLEIASVYNCSASTVSSILKKLNVETRAGGSNNTIADISQWAEMHKNGETLSEIAEKFHTTGTTVSKLLKKHGYDVDRFTYHFDEHYFDSVDSPEKAYILGLLWADGCNSVDKNSVIIQLQDRDKQLLEQINLLTQNERPLRQQNLQQKNNKWRNCYKLVWQSKHLSEILNSYGMVPHKSLVLEFPDWLNVNLYSHFCRGYLDGDGCISLATSNKCRSATVSMVGTRMFLEQVAKIIKDLTGVEVYINRDDRARDPICILRCGKKNDVIKILDWLYCDATIYMQRKYDKYKQFLNNINNSYCA